MTIQFGGPIAEKLHDIARSMIETQFVESEKRLQQDINDMKGRMSARGLLHSSITSKQIHDLCNREIETRAFIVWRSYQKVVFSGLDTLTGLAEELRAKVNEYVSQETPKLIQEAQRINKLIGMGPDQQVEQAKEHALKKVFAEIDLFVHTLENRIKEPAKSGAPGSVVQHIMNSTIGANQIGANLIANVNMTIGSQARTDILQALKLVKAAADSVESLPGCQKEEFVELVVEAETEVKKERPNRLKLGTALTGIATTIQTVGSMSAAYEVLKRALMFCGINLP